MKGYRLVKFTSFDRYHAWYLVINLADGSITKLPQFIVDAGLTLAEAGAWVDSFKFIELRNRAADLRG